MLATRLVGFKCVAAWKAESDEGGRASDRVGILLLMVA